MWEILNTCQKAKKGGHGKYSLIAEQPRGGGNGKYSVVAIEPRREDMGNTHNFLNIQEGRTWEILSSGHTAKEGGHGKYSLVRQIVWLALELGIFPYDLKRH